LNIDDSCLEDIETAALLHDAGKVGVPDAILRKAGPLEAKEWAVMKMHPEYSWAVLRLVPGLERASLFALHHHEKFNGPGYPAGLKGEDIPIGARIVSVIDAFDAMVAERPYKKGLPCEEALRRLIVDSGSHFDPEVVQRLHPHRDRRAGRGVRSHRCRDVCGALRLIAPKRRAFRARPRLPMCSWQGVCTFPWPRSFAW
jgi:HD-GYP domain-containing protein (c-di-GMP phosphodiesterase class II)